MFIENICPMPVIGAVSTASRTQSVGSVLQWRAGSARTAKISAGVAAMVRVTT
jgi:hypothetical protein